MNVETTFFKALGSCWVLVLSLLLTSSPVSATEGELFKYVAPWLMAETLLDNTDRASAPLPPMPGWVVSGGNFKNSFGMTFKTGSSEYILRSVSVMVATPADAAAFSGDLKVSLYEVPEGKFPPSEKPFYESTQKAVSIGTKERFVTLQLMLPRLKPGTWYGVALSAPNESMTRIMGYQVPPREPLPSLGFENGSPVWGDPKNWRSLGYPLIWIEGWDASSDSFLYLKRAVEFGVWVPIGLAGFVLFRFIRKRLKA